MYKILANTLFLGKEIHFLPECHSTNDVALEWIKKKKLMEGTVVICKSQTEGKGQRGNNWVTESGKNLTFSLVLKPDFLDVSEQFLLNMALSNSIRKFFQEYIPQLKVKWPNDLVVPGFGKIGGILIENILFRGTWEYAVVGIGININQQSFDLPTATSLNVLTGSHFDLEELFRLLITQIEQGYILLKKKKFKEIQEEYLHHLYLKNQLSNFSADGMTFSGTISGIDSQGRLEIIAQTGNIISFDLKTIRFLEKI